MAQGLPSAPTSAADRTTDTGASTAVDRASSHRVAILGLWALIKDLRSQL
jgi:hypothetical protein